MAGRENHQPWWERPATVPGEPHYEPKREQLRAELARAWRADLTTRSLGQKPWGGPGSRRAAA